MRGLGLLLLVPLVGGCSRGSDPGRPHLFLITADALRADHLSQAGYPRRTSPELDRFAAEAWRFTEAVTVIPKTGPSFTTHLSGLHPEEHGVQANRNVVPEDVPLLAERLKTAGYATVAFVSNPILEPGKGFARGFDRYETFDKTGDMLRLQRAVLRWMDEADWSRPTFCWVHYIDPHGPYTPPDELARAFEGDELFRADERRLALDYERLEGWPKSYVLGAVPAYQRLGDEDRAAFYVSRYDAEVLFMDSLFGELMERLRSLGLFEPSGILFTSDHGESLTEHDYFFEHGWFVHDTTLRIPFVLKPPGSPEPREVASQVSNLDTAPTLLALAGLPAPPELPGRALYPQPDPGERGPLLVQNCSRYPQLFHGLRTPEWKYVVEEESGAEEWYDLRADPGESVNRLEEARARGVAWREELERERGRMAGAGARAARELEPSGEHLDAIERLGYAGGADEDGR